MNASLPTPVLSNGHRKAVVDEENGVGPEALDNKAKVGKSPAARIKASEGVQSSSQAS